MLDSHFIEVLAWLLLFAALLRAICLGTALLQARLQKISSLVLRDQILGIIEITSFLLVVFLIVPFLLSKYVDLTQPVRVFWLQTVAGNWSPTDNHLVSQYWFTLSAIVAIVLNNGLIVAIILFAWRQIVREERAAMEVRQAYNARDVELKERIFDLLLSGVKGEGKTDAERRSDLRRIIDNTFMEVDRELPAFLKSVFGTQADEFFGRKDYVVRVPESTPRP